MILVANPIYDEAFKFLMADAKAAKVLLSALLGEDIILVDLLPQERSVVLPQVVPQLSVVRFDYCATLEIKGVRKKVLIELQKSKTNLDIARFRRYLGVNYSDTDHLGSKQEILPIIAIYIFGFNMEGVGPAITRFHPKGQDVLEGIPFEPEHDIMLDLLTHVSYFVQLPKLPTRHQNRVGRVLSVFSQHWIHQSDVKKLRLPEELKDDADLRPLVERLERALIDDDTRRKIIEEAAFEEIVLTNLQKAKAEGMAEGIEKGIEKGMEKGKQEERLQIARSLLPVLDNAAIAQATGLTPEEIVQLRTGCHPPVA